MFRIARLSLLPALALIAACGGAGENRFDVLLVGDPTKLNDPKPPFSAATALIAEATRSGLVSLDAEGRIKPDLAARWIVTDDGMSYIFRFEPGEGGDRLTAAKVRRALRAAIARLDGTALGLDLTVIEGIYARTDEVIEIRLHTAMPEFMQLLAAPELALDLGSASGDRLALAAEGPVLHLTRAQESGGGLDIRVAAAADAVARFNDGQAELLLGGDIDALPHVETGGLMRGTIRLDPVEGLFGLIVVPRGEGDFLAEPTNREALAMAIDRDALIAPFGVGGWVARTQPVAAGPPGTAPRAGRWDALTIAQRQAGAKARVAAWQAAKGAVEPITIALPAGRGGAMLYSRLAADLAAIGLPTRRVGPQERAALRLVDEVATSDRPEWYLHRLACRVTRAACDAEADALVAQALLEPAAARRAELLAEAEQRQTATNGFIAFGPPIRFSLVRGGVAGYAINRWGFHPLSPLLADPT